MKHVIYSLLFLTSLGACSSKRGLEVTVENKLNFDRASEMVEIPLQSIEQKIKLGEGEYYAVKNERGEIVTSQVTYDKKIIFKSGSKASSTNKFSIVKDTKSDYPKEVGGRAYPERMDDFAWENDRVGFRFYGNALKTTDGPSNGLDLWYKRTGELVLDKWYKNNLDGTASYHVDHGEGCDPYAVGRTLGGGSMSPFVNDSLWLNENYMSAEVYESGPLRMTFKLIYPQQNIDGEQVAESKVISLDAGSQLTKIVQTYSTTKPISVATGFVKRKENDSIISSQTGNYLLYKEPTDAKNGQIFLGLIIPQGINSVFVNKYKYTHTISKKVLPLSNVLAVTRYTPNTPVTYYTGFGWSKFGYETLDDFENYVGQFSQSLKDPLVITIK